MPGRRVLELGWWLVDFRVENMSRGKGDEGIDRVTETRTKRVAGGRRNEHETDSE
jgi:hypothetical protein